MIRPFATFCTHFEWPAAATIAHRFVTMTCPTPAYTDALHDCTVTYVRNLSFEVYLEAM